MGGKLPFLGVGIIGVHERRLFRHLVRRAEEAIVAGRKSLVDKLMPALRTGCHGDCYELSYLEALSKMYSDSPTNYEGAILIWRRLLRHNKKYAACVLSDNKQVSRYIIRYLADSLYYYASCLYYMESDRSALAAYKNALGFAQRHFPVASRMRDLRHKIDSLSFMLSRTGMHRVEKLISMGAFLEARSLLNRAMEMIGVQYLDHECLTAAAIVFLATDDIRRGRRLSERDFRLSNACLRTRIVYAISHIDVRDKYARRKAMSIALEISGGNTASSCDIPKSMIDRIVFLAKRIVAFRRRGFEVLRFGKELDFVDAGRISIPKCLRFIETNGFRKHLG